MKILNNINKNLLILGKKILQEEIKVIEKNREDSKTHSEKNNY